MDPRNVDWADLVARLQAGDRLAQSELANILQKGMRYMIYRRLGSDIRDIDPQDVLNDSYIIIIESIHQVQVPERLLGWIRTIVERTCWEAIKANNTKRSRYISTDSYDNYDKVHEKRNGSRPVIDPHRTPEAAVLHNERQNVAAEAMAQLNDKYREILWRFYHDEQDKEQIMMEMNLTENTFRLLKSRALDKFGRIGKNLCANRDAVGRTLSKASRRGLREAA